MLDYLLPIRYAWSFVNIVSGDLEDIVSGMFSACQKQLVKNGTYWYRSIFAQFMTIRKK